jgi:serine/threonine protein phosphatase PrpC
VVALRAGSATDVGLVRANNQDAVLTADPLYAVADGMGGAAAGEIASSLAIEALADGFAHSGPPTPDTLVESAQAANRAVWDEAEAHPEMRGMGTTLVAIALVEGEAGPTLAVVNVGDSRLYRLHQGELRQVTYDHNLVAEMVAEGRLTPAEAEVHPRRNIMTRALGVEPEVPVDLFVEEPVVGDRYLLCSDGLPREVSDDLIGSLLRRLADPREAAAELVEEAKRRGGNDNITVVVVDVVDHAPDPASEPVEPPDGTVALAAPEAAVDLEKGAPRRRVRPSRPVRSVLTGRVVAFLLLLAIILVAAGAAVVWYARGSYYVGLRGSEIVIYQGRPGGVLGIDPTVKEDTHYTLSDVLPVSRPSLESGQEVSSLAAANSYVASLVSAYQTAQAAQHPSTTTSPTSISPTTTSPTSLAGSSLTPGPGSGTTPLTTGAGTSIP